MGTMIYRFPGFILIVFLLTACAPAATAAPDLAQQAASEATQIVQQAQATAMIQNARATANVLLTPAGAADELAPIQPILVETADLPAVQPAAATPLPPSSEEISPTVKLMGLSFGANNNLLSVQFLAPVAVVQRWKEGNMYLLDETSGEKYAEIPVMPVIGALFARPTTDGQAGYVMFTNLPVPLKSGAIVTVVLGNYHWEHVPFPMQNP